MSPLAAVILLACLATAYSNTLVEDTIFDQLQSEWEGRIVGGHDADIGQFPHQVSLRTALGQHFCGASIINPTYILTAAHCTQGRFAAPGNIRVVVGAHRRMGDGMIYLASNIHNHPQYNRPGRLANDIALIRLRNPIQYNARIQPVTLPTFDINANGNIPVNISGWGQIRHPAVAGAPTLPDVLQFKRSITVSRNECIRQLGGMLGRLVYENTVCTTNPINVGACMGDSGGPLMAPNNVQIGVVSWGVPCGRSRPDVYASVHHHMAWLRSIMGPN